MNFKDRKEQRKEKHKKRECYWCKKSIKECNPECQCIFCVFDEKFDSWKKDYPNSTKWFKKSVKFYDKLFKEGLAKETKLANKWKHHQLDVVEKTGTNIKDWSADFEVIDGERKIIPNHPGNFQIITPYYDYVQKKTKFRYRYHCQICGEDIAERYFIKHREKKICIGIGIDCAIIFHYSDELTKIIKRNMDAIIKKEFYKLKPFLTKSIEKRLKARRANRKWLLHSLKIIKNYGRKNIHPPRPEKLAELLLDLNKTGFEVFDKEKLAKDRVKPVTFEKPEKSEILEVKTNTETEGKSSITGEKSTIFEMVRNSILEIMKKLGGIHENAVNEYRIIEELQKRGMQENEIKGYIERMLKRKDIREFLPCTYKISDKQSPY